MLRKLSIIFAIFVLGYLTIQLKFTAFSSNHRTPLGMLQSKQLVDELHNVTTITKSTSVKATTTTAAEITTTVYSKNETKTTTKRSLIMGKFQPIRTITSSNCILRFSGGIRHTIYDVPQTALASPWRSGNTWVRHLLQMATGIGTSAVYCDAQLRMKGYPYECQHSLYRRVLVIKTHEPNTLGIPPRLIRKPVFERAVLIIRDPYNFMVANNHKGHLDTVEEDKYISPNSTWQKSQPNLLYWWNTFNDYWLNKFPGPVYPLLYSKLLLDTERELRKLLDFLGVVYTDDDINCVIDKKEGHFHRKSMKWTRIKDIKELFNNTMKMKIDDSVKLLTDHLKRYKIAWTDETHIVEN